MKQINFKFLHDSELELQKKRGDHQFTVIETAPILAPLAKTTAKTASKRKPKASLQTTILVEIWRNLIREYFPDRADLLDYKMAWSSRRQKRTLASCNLRARRILVAQELNDPDYLQYLPALIYHELCHAVLGYSVRSTSGKSRWHGSEFKALEKRHPGIAILNLWIKKGGWRQAIRRHRGKNSYKKPAKQMRRKPRTFLSRFLKTLLLR